MSHFVVASTPRRLALALAVFAACGVAAVPALANPMSITPVFSSAYTPAEQAAVENALSFFEDNMTTLYSAPVTIYFGTMSGGGAENYTAYYDLPYSSYYDALVANNAANPSATHSAAIASLGVPNAANPVNPVTGTGNIQMSSTLAVALGLIAPQDNLSDLSGGPTGCEGATAATSCLLVDTNWLDQPVLLSAVQHEMDEVFGTSSALPNGGVGGLPTDPNAADLYRYSAPGVRSFGLNAATDPACTSAPTPAAYFSIDGGATDLANYNNCDNGGDYGDWAYPDSPPQVQDAYASSNTTGPTLNLNSTEVTVLGAVGYDFGPGPLSVPEPPAWGMFGLGVLLIGGLATLRRRRTGTA